MSFRCWFLSTLFLLTLSVRIGYAKSGAGIPAADEIRIEGLRLPVEIAIGGTGPWTVALTNQLLHPHDHVRTGVNGRVSLRWSEHSVVSIGASTELEILPPPQTDDESGLQLFRGIASFFHRDKPGRIQILTRGARAGVEGTEFVLAVDDADRSTMSVIDGRVSFGNELAVLVLTNGEQAVASPGQAPVHTPGFIVNNLLQWCFYYPAVIDPDELMLSDAEQRELAPALAAYRSGDLPDALAKFPFAGGNPSLSDGEKIFRAALLLAVGEVADAETAMASVTDPSGRPPQLARALRQLTAAVKRQESPMTGSPQLASEWLANSYYQQSLATRPSSLADALHAAQRAAAISPSNGFAWERVAELQFGFGRLSDASDALDQSLALAPRNAQAIALKGFLIAARNHPREAIAWFDRAIATNPLLGNGWLGRGLCKIQIGDRTGGQGDLLMAAAVEPQRAELRNYLARAYAVAGDDAHALSEMSLAEKLDPNDPTAWFYSALFNQKKNRINEAIRDLDKSKELNDNRRVYRSQFLLDQDRSVRNINLAGMYQDADMTVVGQHEAARAVNDDYGNYAAHLFLAESYFPNEFNNNNNNLLRYETLGASEHFITDLLAPPNVSIASSTLSQQAYSQMFLHDGSRVSSSTEYLSRGAWSQAASVYGSYGNFGYSLDMLEKYDPGQRLNDDFESHFYTLNLKQQLTPSDTVLGIIESFESRGGDLGQRYDPNAVSTTFRFNEEQQPNLYLGYHHEWSPGVHTLALLARQNDSTSFYNFAESSLFANYVDFTPGIPTLTKIAPMWFTEQFLSQINIYSGELQQIWEQADHTTILGTRWQAGEFKTTLALWNAFPWAADFPVGPGPSEQQLVTSHFERASVYGYHHWQLLDSLKLIGGLAFDHIHFPENFEYAPVSAKEKTEEQLSPKAGLIWTPATNSTVRLAFTRSLGGATFDQSQTIEPSQVAGFVQSFRSLIPESLVGGTSGGAFQTCDAAFEQKFPTETYLSVSGEILDSQVRRTVGIYRYYADELAFPFPDGQRENLDFQEKSAGIQLNQLLGKRWSLGAGYRVSQAVLDDNYLGLPPVILLNSESILRHRRTETILHQVELSALCNLPNGFFTRGNVVFYAQDIYGYPAAAPTGYPYDPQPNEVGDSFVQLNFFVGYRSPNRKLEVSLGLLNITDQDYRLDTLTSYADLPRGRTLALRLKLDF